MSDCIDSGRSTGWDKHAKAGNTAYVRTRTFSESGKVWIAAVRPSTQSARRLRVSSTMGTASFGFSVPLRKLNIKLPADKKRICLAKPVEGQKATFAIVIAEGRYEQRSVDELAIAAAREARLARTRAKRAERRQQLLKESRGEGQGTLREP